MKQKNPLFILVSWTTSAFLLSCVFASGIAFAAPVAKWTKRYIGAGGDGEDSAKAIAVDASGNAYVAGHSYGASNGADYIILKYNSAGQLQWEARYDGPAGDDDWGTAMAVDSSGNVYVTGQSRGTSSGDDCATVKYNTNGTRLWAARYDGPAGSNDWGSSLVLDASGNVYVTGGSFGTGSDADYITIKYDSNGNELWAERYNGPANGPDAARAVALDGSGNVCVTGESSGVATGYDFATIKYNTNGTQLWIARLDGPAGADDRSSSVGTDGSGNVYVAGFVRATHLLNDDFATVKYDSSGNQLWVEYYDGPLSRMDRPRSMAVDAAGNVWVTGESYDGNTGKPHYATVKYSSAGSELWVARYSGLDENFSNVSTALAVDAAGNAYVTGASGTTHPVFALTYATIQYDGNGNEQWVVRYGTADTYSDFGNAVTVDADGNVYVTGMTYQDDANAHDITTIKYGEPSQGGWATAPPAQVLGFVGSQVNRNTWLEWSALGALIAAFFFLIRRRLLPDQVKSSTTKPWLPLLLLGILFALYPKYAESSDMKNENYYGFVVYTWDEDAPVDDAYLVAKSLGAGWIQAEGPNVLSQSIVWEEVVPFPAGLNPDPDPGDPNYESDMASRLDYLMNIDNYTFDTLSWVQEAMQEDLKVMLTINTGGGSFSGPTGWTEGCATWNDCVPISWNEWFQFVYQVVKYFDGSAEGGPEVTYFKSTEEAADFIQYWGGTEQELFGGNGPVEVMLDGVTTEVWEQGVVPIAYLAVKQANVDRSLNGSIEARYVVGAVNGGLAYPYAHLVEYHDALRGSEAQKWAATKAYASEVYNIDLTGSFDIRSLRYSAGRRFFEQSLISFPEYDNNNGFFYDIYAIHLYDSNLFTALGVGKGAMTDKGFTRAMFYMQDRLTPEIPLWVTGTGILSSTHLWNPYQVNTTKRVAYHEMRTLAGAYASRVEWFTYSFLGNPADPCTQGEDGCNTSLYGRKNYPYRNDAADTFSMMARIFPTRDAFEYDCTLQGSVQQAGDPTFGSCSGSWEGEFDAPSNVVLHKFRLQPDEMGGEQGMAVVGWCRDMIPEPRNQSYVFDNNGCSDTAIRNVAISDLYAALGIPSETSITLYDYLGQPQEICNTTTDMNIPFGEAPFLFAWGQNTLDSDCVPDVIDNCPQDDNASQAEDASEQFLSQQTGLGIIAPDGLGDTCDNCPAASNPPIAGDDPCTPGTVETEYQPDADCDGIGDACDT